LLRGHGGVPQISGPLRHPRSPPLAPLLGRVHTPSQIDTRFGKSALGNQQIAPGFGQTQGIRQTGSGWKPAEDVETLAQSLGFPVPAVYGCPGSRDARFSHGARHLGGGPIGIKKGARARIHEKGLFFFFFTAFTMNVANF